MIPAFDAKVADWVAARIPGCERGFGECQALGVWHKDRIVAGIVFHEWNPESEVIEISGAAEDARWMTRTVLNAIFGYIFDEAGCQMAVARQKLDNVSARRVWLALGGTEHVIPRLYGRHADGSVITLTEEQWRSSRFHKG